MTPFDVHSPLHIGLLCAAAGLAGFVRGFTGFGGPAVISLLLTHLFVPATLVPKIVLLDFCAYPALLWSVRREGAWRRALPIAIAALVTLPLGVETMALLPPETLRRLIGVACVVAVLAALSGRRFEREPAVLVHVLVGAVCGWLIGATFVALPMVTYILMMPYPAATCRATIICISIVMLPCLVALLFYRGQLQPGDVAPLVVAGVTYLGAVTLGSRFFAGASQRGYRMAAQWLLLGLSVMVLI